MEINKIDRRRRVHENRSKLGGGGGEAPKHCEPVKRLINHKLIQGLININ